MILTEEEAKTKWCPEARMLVNAPGYGAGNRFSDDPHPRFITETRCIGSACMAWRRFEGIHGGKVYPLEAFGGYCGKAGRP